MIAAYLDDARENNLEANLALYDLRSIRAASAIGS